MNTINIAAEIDYARLAQSGRTLRSQAVLSVFRAWVTSMKQHWIQRPANTRQETTCAAV